MDLGIAGKVAVVAASSKGLGKASAKALAAEGARVTVCARTAETLEAAAEEIRSDTGADVLAVAADLATAAGIHDVVQQTIARWGGVDICVINTGGPPMGSFWEFDDEQWLAAFETVNLNAVRFIRETVPSMRERGWGRVISIQSSSVKQPVDNIVLSNGTRPGIAGMFKTVVADLAKDGITINLVLPGVFRTDRILGGARKRAEAAGKTLEEQLQVIGSTVPMQRLGEPEELGSLVAFLASERASYITGGVYQVDGGSIRSNV